MSGEARKGAKSQLALAIAQGVSIAKWARANDVPAPTAFRWARDPALRRTVETYRRRTIDEAVGRMAKHTAWAADGIVAVAKDADTYTVKLRAFRAIFSDMMTVSKYSELETRMGALEDYVAQTTGQRSKMGRRPMPPTYAQVTSSSPVRPPATGADGAG
jgi:hypothetical protein